MKAPAPQFGQPLTAREAEVVRLVAEGRSNCEIAGALCLSPLTVKSHLQRIAAKLGTGNRAAMVGAALRTGQLTIPVTGVAPLGFDRRYFEVLVRIARGSPDRVIAKDLGLSEHGVKSRVRQLLVLFEVDSREAAVAAAVACGVLQLVPRGRSGVPR